MNALDAELAIDRLEARLAAELPAHLTASAHSYAAGTPGPSAIEVTPREVAAVLGARSIEELRARSTRLLRVIAPIVLDSAPRVITARGRERTWENWRALAAAREEQAQRTFGMSHRTLVHALAGISGAETSAKSNAGLSGATTAKSNALAARADIASIRESASTGWTRNEREGDGPLLDEAVQSLWSFLRNGESMSALSNARDLGALSNARDRDTQSNARDLGALSNARDRDTLSNARDLGALSNARDRDTLSNARDLGALSNARDRDTQSNARDLGALSNARDRDTQSNARDFGALSIVRSASAHPRTFVVERGVRAIIVVPERIDTPAARFAVLHELGHALLWLSPISREHEWPRAIDEAAASYVARIMENDGAMKLDGATRSDGATKNDGATRIDTATDWYSPFATAARARRLEIARTLDAIEGGAEPGNIQRPPWALWNDPHAQAAYVEAERIADEMPAGLRGRALAEHLGTRATAIDERDWRVG